jgi:hypothetical protein
MAVRTCTGCALTKALDAFTPIRGTPYYYGRCKACRARRAWEQAHPGLRYAARGTKQLLWRTCTECGETKPLDAAFTRIKGCKQGWYGRCRACRAKRAMGRYWADANEREVQKQRAKHYRDRRKALVT